MSNNIDIDEMIEELYGIEIKKRVCIHCGDQVYFGEFLKHSGMKGNDVKKIWDSEYVEILCCKCFKRLVWEIDVGSIDAIKPEV